MIFRKKFSRQQHPEEISDEDTTLTQNPKNSEPTKVAKISGLRDPDFFGVTHAQTKVELTFSVSLGGTRIVARKRDMDPERPQKTEETTAITKV